MVNRFFGFSCKMDAVLFPFEVKYVMSMSLSAIRPKSI